MKPEAATIILPKLESLTQPLISLLPEEVVGTGLTIHRRLINQETRQPIFVYVDRLELIEYIRKSAKLHKCRTSNSKANPEDTQ